MGGIYQKEIEELLKESNEDNEELSNILKKYDNYTYHIQFFMIPADIVSSYTNSVSNESNIDDVIKNNKVIIAESGITGNISIKSLKLKTYTPVPYQGLSVTPIIDLVLEEHGGVSLVNKISLASKLLGYEAYVRQPYFLTIKFLGYDGKTGNPESIIKKDGKELKYTYMFYASSVDTKPQEFSTTYTFNFVSSNFNILTKDLAIINKINSVSIKKGSKFDTALKDLEKEINKSLYDNLPDFAKECYKDNNKKIIEFELIRESDEDSPETSLSSDDVSQIFTINSNDNIYSAIDRLYRFCEPTAGNVPFIDVKMKKLGDKQKSNLSIFYPFFHIKVMITSIPGLKKYKNQMKDMKWLENVVDIQKIYLTELRKRKALKKHYSYNFNGINSDVLNYKQTDDQLWFLNVSLPEQKTIFKNAIIITDNSPNILDEKDEVSGNKDQSSSSSESHDILLDDFCLDNKNNLSFFRDGAIGSLSIFQYQKEVKKESNTKESNIDATKENDEQSKARIGAENYFSIGQKIKIDLEINGDPDWLLFGCENANIQSILEYNYPHIIFHTRGPLLINQPNSNYITDYKRDEKMDFNAPYRIISVESVFSDGKFTQNLNGVIVPLFTQTRNQKVNILENKRATVSPTVNTNLNPENITTNNQVLNNIGIGEKYYYDGEYYNETDDYYSIIKSNGEIITYSKDEYMAMKYNNTITFISENGSSTVYKNINSLDNYLANSANSVYQKIDFDDGTSLLQVYDKNKLLNDSSITPSKTYNITENNIVEINKSYINIKNTETNNTIQINKTIDMDTFLKSDYFNKDSEIISENENKISNIININN